jgi:hypothetical protein
MSLAFEVDSSLVDSGTEVAPVSWTRNRVRYVMLSLVRLPPRVKMSWYRRSSNPYVRGGREKMELLGDQA